MDVIEEEAIIKELKVFYGATKLGGKKRRKRRLKNWKSASGDKLAGLIMNGVPFRRVVNSIGCSKELVASAIKNAGFPQLLSDSVRDLIETNEAKKQGDEEMAKREQLKDAFELAKKTKKLKEWQKSFGPALVGIIQRQEASFVELVKEIGCSARVAARAIVDAGGSLDLLPKYLQSYVRGEYEKRKKVKKLNKPDESPVVKSELEKYGPEFWDSLAKGGKVGDIMAAALISLINQLADCQEENRKLQEEFSRLQKAAADCKEKLDRAEKTDCEIRALRERNNRLLAQSLGRAGFLAVQGEKSLNDGA